MNRLNDIYGHGLEMGDESSGFNRYDVYVNGDFVGIKPLIQQNETIEDINDFLKEQGCHQFQAIQHGDHYLIEAMNHEEAIKQVLQMYLQMR